MQSGFRPAPYCITFPHKPSPLIFTFPRMPSPIIYQSIIPSSLRQSSHEHPRRRIPDKGDDRDALDHLNSRVLPFLPERTFRTCLVDRRDIVVGEVEVAHGEVVLQPLFVRGGGNDDGAAVVSIGAQ